MKIMFVCTGNTCRSVMAQALCNKLAKQYNKNIESYSCGINAYNGDGATYNSIQAMKDYDVDISPHKAQNIKDSDIKSMDLILCATISHKNMVLQLYPDLNSKIFTIKEYANASNNVQDLDIKDPWGYNISTYTKCAEELNSCIIHIINKIVD